MAPKKKKKAASNPARGFATVSLPSKSRAGDAIAEAEVAQPEHSDDLNNRHEPHPLVNGIQSLQEPSSLQDLSPEQLEEHLEDAELQIFVEKFGERSKRDAARQLARLETERRTLRAQALPLETEAWLTQDIVDEVITLSKDQVSVRGRESLPLHPTTKAVSQEELLLKLWTLQQLLKALQITQEEQVLKHMVSLNTDYISTSKDYIWGLEESFDWLALHASPEQLPQYHLPSLPSQNQRSVAVSSSERSRAASRDRHMPKQDLGREVEESNIHHTLAIGNDNKKEISETQPASSASPNDSTDDDNDPDELVSRYIDTRSRLLKAEPEFQCGKGAIFDSKAPEKLSPSQIHRLRQKLEAVERDILFDHDRAAVEWAETSNRMRSELAEERRRQPASDAGGGVDSETELDEDAIGPREEFNEAEDSAEGLFGDIFTTVEKYTPGRNDATESESEGAPMLLTDFGKYVGISPRRVLEETCKVRDARCKITFRLISSSSHSNRHSIQITWSRPQQQEISFSALPPRLSCAFDALCVNLAMETIATPTALQSESYISTVTLFALSADEPKEEKVFLRLPPVWRDLWSELLQQRQAEIALADKSTLRVIRTIVNESMTQGKRDDNVIISGQASNNQQNPKSVLNEHTTSTKAYRTPAQLEADWQRKADTPRYQAMLKSRQQLPIFEQRERILRSIDEQQVTVLCAETGAGKSTQVPAFILEHELSSGRDCRILVTQPRRISAMSLARRVSEELGEAKGDIGTHRSLVGFAIRLESKTTAATRITYATTGVLLRMLEGSQDLQEISHLVLDEVHERTLDLDLAFIAIKRLLACRPGLKVVLMSATVDAHKFSRYFGNAPVLTLPGRTYPVEVKYLEDAIEDTLLQTSINGVQSYETEIEEQTDEFDEHEKVRSAITGLEHYSPKTRAAIATYDEYRIDYALITNLAAVIASHKNYSRYSRALLIFMPGIAEIRRLHHMFLSHSSFTRGWSFFLLHSSFSSEDLEMAFMPPPAGTRKIVIATNIAETGITIPDITAVIDTCKEKTMRFDERRQMSKLTENFTSKSSCRQRRGRAARVQDGLCFHLLTRYRYENLLPEQHVPEILRLSLQDPVMRIKIWGFGDIDETLSQAIDPPTSKNIRRAVDALKDLKAMTSSEALTPLGRQLARLPLDIWLGKLAILGIVFQCLDAAVTIASIMSSKSPFLASNRGDPRVENAKLCFKRGDSDLLLTYNAYVSWRRSCNSRYAAEFCRKNLLDQQALSQIEDQKVQLLVALADARILKLDETEMSTLRRARASGRNREFFTIPDRHDSNNANDNALTSMIAVAFYPKLLVREGKGWRNISTNQQVNLAPSSVNRASLKPPTWLSFHETMQTKSKLPSVFDTSAVPESAIVMLLGDAEFRMFAGVVAIDGSKIRFRVRNWRVMVALKMLRSSIQDIVAFAIQNPGKSLSAPLQPWADLWQKILAPIEQGINLQSTSLPRR